jgi:3',5'-cyclic-AMP phosphodiesterase
MTDTILHDHNDDGVDRRGFLKCMAWAGTGMLWAVNGGVLSSVSLSSLRRLSPGALKGELFFAQISDSHIGFSKEANPDVTATLQAAVQRVNGLPQRPAFVLHTGDISQLSKPSEFDTADQVIKGIKTERVFYVPGEHDVLTDNGQGYLERYGKGVTGGGWYSFDHGGAHFIGLVNVLNLKAGGLGSLGPEQLDWLKKDVRRLSSSTPIVVFAHIPLWAVYPEWGWGTDDSEQALGLLKRFGSVGVLNGHIHQVLQKVEGNVRFHTAMSTAFPQPAPGTAPSPGPLKVEAERLRKVLGIASVEFLRGHQALAVVDSPLDNSPAGAGVGAAAATGSVAPRAVSAAAPDSASSATAIKIDNFSFSPPSTTVPAGTTITWVNADDVPHKIVSSDGKFAASPALDTNDRYAFRFTQPGRYEYFCGLHPKMTGAIVVQ